MDLMLTQPNPEGEMDDAIGTEPFRPQYHFTPRRNWVNDPNGLVYFEGEYHLFYQYNPHGMDWGHMSWGHAVSADLVSWRELPVAIPETDQMIFSGSVVVDWENVSGLGEGKAPPLLAFFTAFDEARSIQSQHLAVSHDRGRTFVHYAGNPIIDLDLADFRDPKVFYHAESGAWIMLVALARDHYIQFYRSQNLLDWTLAGSFGPMGSTSGQWECPDLIRLSMDEDPANAHWVLKVDVDVGLVDGGSGAQYFVGQFDGHRFTMDPELSGLSGALVDQGPDFYAAVTWSDLPAEQASPVWIGWQSNHQSGKAYPTYPWRGAMSLPRELYLFPEGEKLKLGQRPLKALTGLRSAERRGVTGSLAAAASQVSFAREKSFWQDISLGGDAGTTGTVSLSDGHETLLTITVAFGGEQISFERHASAFGPVDFFERKTTTRLPLPARIDLQILVDGSLVEIFVNGGRRVYSASLFASDGMSTSIECLTGTLRVERDDLALMQRSIDFSP
ncbi:glycoside hydrolase family 32 protein [Sphingomonas sp. NIBR02145]|uniref:glycoside hydrolase family 32 protein n=1 Tax=Sphingomonas sp. NIBR02145 TaxID=3014784 RepID=UPI0022B3E894|nr:glycoside hydrolase family 32 protein [Sphingomonas sp. NIBR02145]WHU04297.1 glycoside hydrolase family 32 protein [Sphingomonas sp. NIBR02145]